MPTEIDREKLLPINVIRTGFKEHQYHVIRNDGYAAYQISVCTSGEGIFVHGNREHTVRKGDVFLFSPRTAHEYYPVSAEWSLYFFVFTGECIENLFRYFRFGQAEVFSTGENYEKIKKLSINLENTSDDYLRSLYIYEMLGIIASLSKHNPESAFLAEDERYRKTAPVLDYIRKNYKNPISLDELAELINVSKSYLCRIFRTTYNMTPIKYLLNYRIDRAKQLLISTDIKMKYLCEEVGFNDISYFCMAFRQSEGMTPEEFRNLHKD